MSGGGHGPNKIVMIVIIFLVVGFIVFLALQIGRGNVPSSVSTTTPIAGEEPNEPRPRATSTVFHKFFKLLGYDFSNLNTPVRRTTPPPTPPSTITTPPTPAPYTGPIPEGFIINDLSSYYGKIRITNVSHPDLTSIEAFRNSYSEIGISVSLPKGERVRITGWTIKTRDHTLVIPRGNEVLRPNSFQNEGDIFVDDADYVRIFSHAAPAAINFKLNQCTGYLTGYIPSISRSCPYIYQSRAALSRYSGLCQDYVLSLSRCEIPRSNPPIAYNDAACFDILRTANYEGCFNAHRLDANFLENEWRIYLGTPSNPQKNILDPRHDKIEIYDAGGELVSQYIY